MLFPYFSSVLKIAFRPEYHHSLPEGHRFPMEKYSLLPQQLLHEGTVYEKNFFAPDLADNDLLLAVHDKNYLHNLDQCQLEPAHIRRIGFPLSPGLVLREKYIMEGTRQCAAYALQYGVAMNIAGGTHHAYAHCGEGFCLLNDIAVGAQWLLDQKKAQQILVVDLDVHQGNGTAKIFEHQQRVFTFSMHGEKNYPLFKEKSDLDIGLPDGIDDKTYLQILKNTLPRLFDEVQPDFVFFQSGVDILETDKLGRLGVSMAGCRERDRYVLKSCQENKVPVVASMGGGYSPLIKHIIEAHANTYRLAQEIFF